MVPLYPQRNDTSATKAGFTPHINLCGGFTLVEILIVTGIIAILSGSLVLYGTTGRKQSALYIEGAKVAQVILRAKSLAIAGFTAPNAPCGYGVHIDNATERFSLFSYRDTNCDAISSLNPSDPTKYREMESFSLNPAVVFENCSGRLDEALFVPPDPTTFLFRDGVGLGEGQSSGVICFATTDGTARLTLTVSAAGQITF